MVVSEGLYDRGHLIDFGGGEVVLYRNPIYYKISVSDVYHPIAEGDTLHSIARKYFGFSSAWFMIADVNDDIDDIFILPEGDTILIPSIGLIQSLYGRSE